jgi:hypothetical protein
VCGVANGVPAVEHFLSHLFFACVGLFYHPQGKNYTCVCNATRINKPANMF